MKTIFRRLRFFVFWLPVVAHAHSGSGDGGFIPGLVHPALGLDHLLAMLSVGILSAQIGGSAIWKVPSSFVGCMLLGGIAGLRHLGLERVELGIAISVMMLGLALAVERKVSRQWAMLGVGGFGLLHGYAHGEEIPALLDPFPYVLGFVFGTSGIHILGVAIGHLLTRTMAGVRLLRILGAVIAGCGLFFAVHG